MSDQTQVIAKTSYTHDAMIDLLVANPHISQSELAAAFGYTPGWISRILRADSFRERFSQRKSEVTDPLVLQAVEQQFEALVTRSLEILQEKLSTAPSTELALKTAELGSRALGYGAKQGGVNIQQNFVVAMPQKAKDAQDWLDSRIISDPFDLDPSRSAR